MIDWANVLNTIFNWLVTEGVKIVVGFIVVYILFKLINLIFKRIDKKLSKKKVDLTIKNSMISILRKILKILVLILYVEFLGFQTSSIAAIIASTAVAIGLALQGMLTNLASGVMILLLRPYRLGDYIDTSSGAGTVTKIELFQTYLEGVDKRLIIVPNKNLLENSITNYSVNKTRRLELIIPISYSNDFRKAKLLIRNEIEKSGLALKDPEPFVNIIKYNDSSIDIVVRVWTNSADYWDLNWFLLESIKLSFDKNGIEIPYTKLDVQMIEEKNQTNDDDEFVKEEIKGYKIRREKKLQTRNERIKKQEEESFENNKNIIKKLNNEAKLDTFKD